MVVERAVHFIAVPAVAHSNHDGVEQEEEQISLALSDHFLASVAKAVQGKNVHDKVDLFPRETISNIETEKEKFYALLLTCNPWI